MIAKTTLDVLMRDLQDRSSRREALSAASVADTTTPSTEAIIYVRGAGPENTAAVASQLEVCREIAAQHDLVVFSEIQDDTPDSFETERPGWETAVRLLTHLQVDVLICADWSSINRHDDDRRTVVELARRFQFTILTGDDTFTPAPGTSPDRNRS